MHRNRLRRTGRVAAKVIPDTSPDTLRDFARRHLRRRGTLYSDSATGHTKGLTGRAVTRP